MPGLCFLPPVKKACGIGIKAFPVSPGSFSETVQCVQYSTPVDEHQQKEGEGSKTGQREDFPG